MYLLLAAVERLDGQRLDVNDRRFEPPCQYVHRSRMVPQQQDRLDGTHVDGTEHSTVSTARFIMLFPVFDKHRTNAILSVMHVCTEYLSCYTS